MVRKDPRFILVEADLAGADWVVTAYEAQEPRMIEVCEGDLSPHVITGHLVTGAPIDMILRENALMGHITDPYEIKAIRDKKLPEIYDVTTILPRVSSIRQGAKKWNHAFNYGMGPDRYSLENLVPLVEAKTVHSLYLNKAYPGLLDWQLAIRRRLRKDRTLYNCFGRKITFQGSWGPDLFNKAYSWIPQSTVGEITIEAMVNFHGAREPWVRKAESLCQVHDSVVAQYPLSAGMQDLAAFIKDICMKEQYLRPWCEYHERRFQIDVECKIGFCWGRMYEIIVSNDVGQIKEEVKKTLAKIEQDEKEAVKAAA